LQEALDDIDRMERKFRTVILDAGFTERRTTLKDIAVERQVQSELTDLANEILDELKRRLNAEFWEIHDIQREEERHAFAAVYGLAVASQRFSSTRFLINGVTVNDQVNKMRDDMIFRIMGTIRDSHAAGVAEEEMWHRIRGKKTDSAYPGELLPTRRAIETTIRTGVSGVQTNVQMQLDLSTKAPKHGWQHISVLDNRTSDVCRSRAWKRWNAEFKPIGHAMEFRQPPLHANCRSRMLLIFVDDPQPAQVSFREWIEQLTAEQQKAVFGEANLRRWRSNRISDAELIRQADRPLSPEQLRKITQDRQGQFNF